MGPEGWLAAWDALPSQWGRWGCPTEGPCPGKRRGEKSLTRGSDSNWG